MMHLEVMLFIAIQVMGQPLEMDMIFILLMDVKIIQVLMITLNIDIIIKKGKLYMGLLLRKTFK
jgi:hypothetical protein